MKKKTLGLITVLWLIICMSLCAVRGIDAFSDSKQAIVDATKDLKVLYLAENSENGKYIYKVADNKIAAYAEVGSKKDASSLVKVVSLDGYIYAFTEINSDDKGTSLYAYVYDNELNFAEKSSVIQLAFSGNIKDISLTKLAVYIAQASDSKYKAYLYRTNPTDLLNCKETVNAIDSVKTEEIIESLKLDGNNLLINTEGYEDELLNAALIFTEASKESINVLAARYKAVIIWTLIAFVLGLLVIFLLPVMLKKRNRFAFAFIVWEVCLIALVLIYVAISRHIPESIQIIYMLIMGSIIGLVLGYLQNRDIINLEKAVWGLVHGDFNMEKPLAAGQDLNNIWNSIIQLSEKFKSVNYDRYKTYEQYYRFSPKSVEAILGKKSITDIKSGDFIQMHGTVAIMSNKYSDNRSIKADEKSHFLLYEKIIELISYYQEKNAGFMVSTSYDLSELMMLFSKGCDSADKFGIEFRQLMSNYAVGRNSYSGNILLHTCNITYGVLGNNNQSMQFLYSKDIDELKKHQDFLRLNDVGFAMTEEALNTIKDKPQVRYIGEIKLDSRDEPVKIYHVLDAVSGNKKALYISQKESFESAIELVKQRDFYLARNAFGDILRNNQDDGMARWYLYICEKYLENPSLDFKFEINQ